MFIFFFFFFKIGNNYPLCTHGGEENGGGALKSVDYL